MKLLTAFVFLFTTTFTFINNTESIQTVEITESMEMDCPFTFDQGYDVGCGLARQANKWGCEVNCYALFAKNTVDKYAITCPDYSDGVYAGFFACFEDPVFANNEGGNIPSDNEIGAGCYWDKTTHSIVCP